MKLDVLAEEFRQLTDRVLHRFAMAESDAGDGPHAALNKQEVRLVEHLGDRGPRMMRELAGHLLLAVNSMTSVVDNLEAKGLVARVRSNEDRRVVRVELTEAGRDAYRSATHEKVRMLRAFLEPLTATERQIFLELMRKIAASPSAKPNS